MPKNLEDLQSAKVSAVGSAVGLVGASVVESVLGLVGASDPVSESS